MTDPVHKVTCFITRPSKSGTELLLFIHPQVGVQIPAGTVNPGEELEVAARREAVEESGLNDLKLVRLLGKADDPPPPGVLLVSHPNTVYSRPDAGSLDWALLRHGLPVEVLRHAAGFTQVCYEEHDNHQNPHYITYNITGWVPDDALTDRRIRHFYLFNATCQTPERWSLTWITPSLSCSGLV